ncbi:MAG: recombinase family protein [Oscillospiraceae bacterium]|nr:recombinase family protein [Oscillospiraceae bacterium]
MFLRSCVTAADDGWSGTGFERPAFKELLEDIKKGLVGLVITKDLSRLGRDYIMTGYYIERWFPEHRVRYIAVNDGIDTGRRGGGMDVSPFINVVNDMYAADISRKVRSALDAKKRAGRFIGSGAPYGYVKSPEDKNRLVIRGDAAEVVRRIYREYISGRSMSAIASGLSRDTVPTPSQLKRSGRQAAAWNERTVKHILTNPTYCGCMTQNKSVKLNHKSDMRVLLPRDEWICVENANEAIVSRECFEPVGKLREERRAGIWRQPRNTNS